MLTEAYSWLISKLSQVTALLWVVKRGEVQGWKYLLDNIIFP
jgi:hypothetical protein